MINKELYALHIERWLNDLVSTHCESYRMALIAAYLCKQHFGAYPERIGLDWYSRMDEYANAMGRPYLEIKELVGPVPEHWTPETQLTLKKVFIAIEPAVFGSLAYVPGTPVIQYPPDHRAQEEVICEYAGNAAFMSIWFSSNGYDVVIWDDMEASHDSSRLLSYEDWGQ